MHTVEGHVAYGYRNRNDVLKTALRIIEKRQRRKKVTSVINLISGHFVNQCHSHLITSVIKGIMQI